jgi:hypothetical protein
MSKSGFVRGVRPCVVALRVDADDGNTFWDYLNVKNPHQPLCFSLFQPDIEEAITIFEGHAFLRFGFTSNRDGSITHHRFDTPKEITFVLNFTNSEVTQELTATLPCPHSGSFLQNQLIEDKSIQRMILTSSGDFLKLLVSKETHTAGGSKYDALTSLNAMSPTNRIDIIDFETIMSHLRELVTHYFHQHPMEDKIVIKTTSWKTIGNTGCLILNRSDTTKLPEKLKRLNISPFDNVLVERYTVNVEQSYHFIRVYSTRSGKSVAASVAIPTTLSPLFYTSSGTMGVLSMFHVDRNTGGVPYQQIRAITQQYWDTILPHLMRADNDAELMVFAFDFVLSPEGPVCIKVSSLDSLSLFSLYVHERHGDKCGHDALCGMFNHMLTRSYDYMLQGRTLILIGTGTYNKHHFIEHLSNIGANIILLASEPPPANSWASGFAKHFIKVLLHDTVNYKQAAREVAAKLKELNVDPFSVYTLSEDCVPFRAILTSVLREEGILKTSHHATSFESAIQNKDKLYVYDKIRKSNLLHSGPGCYSIAPNAIVLDDENVTTTQIDCPHILKLSTSCGAFGCMRIDTTRDILPAYQAARKLIADASADFGFGMCFGVKIFMSELYEGSEHDLDVIMCDGEPVFVIFSDNLPVAAGEDTSGLQFLEKGCVMPSTIIRGLEAQKILTDVVHILNDMDLSHGAFNIEFILNTRGIKIIDINQRPGGYYIHEWVNAIAGICIFTAEVILRSELEYFLHPLTNNRTITGYNVFSEQQLVAEATRYSKTCGDVRIFRMHDPHGTGEPCSLEFYATVYGITDSTTINSINSGAAT